EGVTRASGASEPGIDGIHDARALQENESVWLIAEYFETSPAEAQAVLDELQVKGTEAMGAWSIREGFTPSMGDRVTEAFDNKARNRNRNNRNDTEQQD
ncbi:MAG TPA: hypothetical protein VGO07_02190, partial [Candidatus Saccharimonadales bacterium]|nr:hypothetical protein [Candidatus Saccharimonadales bacterium]